MAKFNVGGVVLANVFANGIEANTKEEAIKKLKKMLESKDFIDWADWYDIEVSESIDYSEKVNKALYNSGYGVKVVEMPKLVSKGKADITDMIGEVELWRCKLNNDKTIVVFIHGEKIYLPCNPFNFFLVFDSDCCEAAKIKQPNDVFRYYWLDNNDVYTISKIGNFMCIYNSETKYNPVLGQRLSNVRKYIDEDFYIIHSMPFELNLGLVNDANVTYDAYFEEAVYVEPLNITMSKRIL